MRAATSLYSNGATNENYLRGVQEADADGTVTFTSIFPACYPGRWPHAHFEVYASLADATGGGDPIATSQLAFPEDVSNEVYATTGYEQSVANLAELSLESDMVFADGADQQLGTMGGSVSDGADRRPRRSRLTGAGLTAAIPARHEGGSSGS